MGANEGEFLFQDFYFDLRCDSTRGISGPGLPPVEDSCSRGDISERVLADASDFIGAVFVEGTTGLDAAPGLGHLQDKLESSVKGWTDPNEYFSLFANSIQVEKESHAWFRGHVVTSYDDHDHAQRWHGKRRFAADPEGPALELAALALNATTLGIPCIYCGSEQCFDGSGDNDVCASRSAESRWAYCFGEWPLVYRNR